MKPITNSFKVALLLTLLPFGRAAFAQCTGVTSAITAGGATTFCSGGSVALTANSTQGNAISLSSASSQYVDLGVDLTNLSKADFTIEAWIKTTGISMGIVTFNNSNTNWQSGEKSFYIGSTGLPTFVGHGNDYIYGNLAVNDGSWHHVAVVWDYTGNGTTTTGIGKMYIDGVDRTGTVGYAANNNNIAGGTFKIGAPNYEAGEAPNYFNGQIDEVRVWNIARAQSAIQGELYKKLTLPIATLPGYYTFDEASGNATNYSTGGGTGILTNGAARVTSTAFNGGNTYSWSSGATTSAINASTSGNYTVSVTTAGGCTLASSATTVTVNSATATASATTPCVGGTLNLTATGGVSYSWIGPYGFTSSSQNPSRASATTSMSGTYTVTVTDANNCTATASVSAIVLPLPTATITASGTTTFCSGGSVTLTANSTQGNAVQLASASSQFVNLGANITELGKADFTLEAWVKTTGVSEGIVTFTNNSNTTWDLGEKSFYLDAAGKPTFVGFGNNYITSTTAVNNGAWHHVAVVWDYSGSGTAGNGKIYIDGVDLTLSSTYSANNNNLAGGTFKIGTPNYGAGEAPNYFNGMIDEVRIWNVARTQAQVQANLYKSIVPTTTGLVSYYLLEEGTGTATADAKGVNNGTLVNSAAWTTSQAFNSGNTYLWSNGATTSSITVTSGNNYTVAITSAASCSSTSAATTVTVNSLPTASASGNTPCVGGTLNLISSGGTSYSWTGPNGFSSTLQNPSRTNVTAAMAGTYTVAVTNASSCASTANVVISVSALPTAAASANTPCAGGTLNLTSSGGISYSWTGPNSFASTLQNPSRTNATAAMAGTYTVTVTGANGCTATATVNVTINALPVAAAGSNTPCAGNTLNLTSSGGTSYSWAGPNSFTSTSQNPNISNVTAAAAGTYTVTVTNSNGCVSTATKVVTINALPTATATSNSPCVGGTLNLTASGGTSYSWSGPGGYTSTAQNPSRTSVTTAMAGTYTVTVTGANGCTAMASTIASVGSFTPQIVAPSPCIGQTLTAAGGNALYFDGTGHYMDIPGLSLNSNGGAITVEFWLKVNANEVGQRTLFNFTTADGQRIQAHVPWSDNTIYWDYGDMTGNGRVSTDMSSYLGQWVHVALVSEGKNGTFKGIYFNGALAASSTVSDGASTVGVQGGVLGIFDLGGTQFWHKGGVDNFRVWKEVRTQAQIQQYMSTSLGASPANLTAYYTFDEYAGTTVVDYSGNGFNGTLSIGASTTLPQRIGGMPGGNTYTYLWGTGATTSSITASTSGTYTLTVTNASGCAATAAPLTILAAPTASANTPCIGGTLNLTASGGTSYSWTGPNSFTSTSQNPSISNVTAAAAGTYTATVTNASGCTYSVTATATLNPLPVPVASANSPCVGGTLNLTASGGTSYSWTGPNGFTSTSQSPSRTNVTAAMAGSYTVTVTNANGCSSSATVPAGIYAAPTPVITATSTTFCSGNSATLTANQYGYGLALNGTNTQYASAANAQLPLGNSARTIEAWIKTTEVYQVILGWGTLTTSQRSGLSIVGGKLLFVGQNNDLFGTTTINDGNWHHIAASYDGTTLSLFVDGVANGTKTYTTALNTTGTTFRIGRAPGTGTDYYTGTIDEVRIWNTARTQAEIQASMSQTVPASSSGLVAYYNFEEGTGSTAIDATGNAHAVLVNSPTYTTSTAFSVASTYLWSTGATTQAISVTSTGNYSVTTVTGYGCSATSAATAITVNQTPVATATSNGPLCAGSTLNLTSTGAGTYAWTGPGNFTSTLQNPSISSITSAGTGTYTVTVTAASGCTATASVSVTVNAAPGTTAEGFTSVSSMLTSGWVMQNNSSPNGSTTWFQGNTAVFSALSGFANSYVGVNYASTGNTGDISNWLITPALTLNNGDVVSFYTRSPAGSVWADRLQLRMSTNGSSTNVGTGSTSIGDFTTLLTDVNAGLAASGYPQTWTKYTVTISGLAGSVTGRLAFRYFVTNGGNNGANSDYIGIDDFNHIPAAQSATVTVCEGSTINLISAYSAGTGGSYAWSGPNSFSSSVQNPSISSVTTAMSGTYTVTITNSNGCATSAATAVTVNPIPVATASSTTPCVGGTINLTAATVSGASYSWTGPDSFTSTLQNPSISNVTTANSGIYTVNVTSNGCSSTASTTVAVGIDKAEITASATSFCTSQPATLTASGGSALAFDGTGHYMNVPGISLNSDGGAITIEFWVKVNSTDVGNRSLFSFTTADGMRIQAHIPFNDSRIYWDYGNLSTTGRLSTNMSSYLGKWTHVALVSAGKSGTFKGIYLNGTLVASSTTSDGASTLGVQGMKLGLYSTSQFYHKGYVDNFRVWKEVRSQAQIQQYMSTALSSSQANLAAYYTFDENSGTTITDYSGNGYTGTLTQGASTSLPQRVNGVTGGNSYTYLWNTGATTSSITATTSGSYSVTVTDANGCSASATPVSLTAFALPVPAPSANTPCIGGTLNLAASGGTSYSWTGPNSFTSTLQNPSRTNVTAAMAGTYAVTVTDGNGCSATATTTVSINALPTATAANNGPICAGATLNLTASGGSSYSWTGPNGFASTDQSPILANVTAAMAGTYTVTVADGNNCSATATTSVTINALPTPTVSANTPCAGGTLNLASSGGTTYSWTGPNGFTSTAQNLSISSVTAAAAGNYIVTVTNANGCTSSANVTVTINALPVATAGNDGPHCAGLTLSLTASGGTSYSWSGPNGFTSSLQSPSRTNTTTAMSGTYTVTVTDGNGCSSTASTSVVINALLAAAAGNSGPVCEGTTLNLTASGGTSYSWTGPNGFVSTDQNPVLSNTTPAMTGVYTVTVTNGNNCVATATTTAVVNATPVIALSPAGPVALCQGDSVTLSEAIGQGTSLVFDGTDDYGRIPRSIQDDFTIEYWVKTTQTGSTGSEWFWGTGLVDAETANQINDFGTSLLGNKLAFGTGGTPEKTLLSTVTINDGVWHHIAATRHRATGQMKLYIDGVLDGSRIGSLNSLTSNGFIGLGNQTTLSPTHYFQGQLDELRIWNVVRSAEEIASHYKAGISPTSTGLVAYYPMNEGTGTSLVNAVGSSYTGTLTNGVAWTPSTAFGSTYAWSTGATTPTITVDTADTYSVIVTNATGCNATSMGTTVTVNPLPVVTVGSNSPVCTGNPLNLTATGGTSYAWSGPNGYSSTLQNPTLSSATAAMAGTYYVTVTDANGCKATDSTTVIINGLPTASATNDGPHCEGSTLNLTASAGTSYSWAGPNGFTSSDQNPQLTSTTTLMTGVYTVTVMNSNGCTSTATTGVNISKTPVAAITAGGSTTFCQGSSVTLTAGSTQGTALQLTRASSQYVDLQNNITNLSKADFTIEAWVKTTSTSQGIVTVSDGDGVWESGEKSFYLTSNGRPYFVGFGSNYITSTTSVNDGSWHHVAVVWDYTGNGTTTTGTGKIYIDGVDRTLASGYIANNNNLGTFRIGNPNYGSTEAPNYFNGTLDEVRVWNVARTQADVQANLHQTLTNTTGLVSSYRFEEGNGTTTADASGANPGTLINGPAWIASGALAGGNTYLWSTGATTASISATASGSYSVTVTSSDNCLAVSPATTINVNPLPVAAAGYNGPLCVGNTLNLTASGGTSYAWTGPNGYTSTLQNPTRTNVTAAMAGTYTVTVKDGNNCTATASVSAIINTLPVASASNSGAVCTGGTISLSATGGTSYSWTGPAGFTSTAQNPVLTNANPGMAGNYVVTVTDGNSCSSTATTSVTINALPGAVVTASGTSACQNVGVALTANAANALNFDGTGHYMNVPGMNLNSNGGAITIEFWVKVNTADVGSRSLFNFTTADGNRIQAHVPWNDNRLYWDYGNLNTTGRVSTLFTSYLNQWTHVAFVSAGKNGTFKGIYINGVLVASGTTSDGASTVGVQGMKLGLFSNPSTFLFKGSVDEFRVWQEVRTQSQIQQYMNMAVSGSTANLAAYYSFDESTGITVTDQSLNGFHGTLIKGTSAIFPQRVERGTSTYSYLWNTGATTQSITATTSGNYSVTIIDANGCSATSASLAVTVNPLPTVTAGNNGPLCAGTTLNLTATGGTSYAWTGPNGYTSTAQNPTRTGTTAAMSGIYTVTVTDGNGCAASASTNVTINALPLATASATADVCEGGSYTLSASGGTSYSWTGPNGYTSTDQNPVLSNVTTDATGTYTVTVSDNGCSATASVAVSVKPVMVPVITASGPTSFCAGNSVTLTASGPGSGLQFTATSSQAVLGANPLLPQGNSARTVEAWIKTTTAYHAIVNWGTAAVNKRAGISMVGGKLFYVGQSNDMFGTSIINDGNWHHVAVTYDGTTMKMYIDGTLDATKTFTTAFLTTGTTLQIGRNLSNTEYYTGTLDEVRIWNVARSQAELQANRTHEIQSGSTGLVAYFKFQEGSGTTTADATGNGTGTFFNSPVWVSSNAVTSMNSYLWSTGATTQSITVSSSGSYSVTTSNTAGCSATSAPMVVAVGTTTTWTGAASTDWYSAANWTACVPNQFTDAIIPASLARYPVITTGTAESKDLQLAGTLTLSGGELNLYGDFVSTGTFTHTNGMFEVAGSGAQQIAGAAFHNLTINGSGNKTLSNNAAVANILAMSSGVLVTGSDTLTLGATAQMTETSSSFVIGQVHTARTVGTNLETFGGIGFTMDPAVSPGLTRVTRVTGDEQTGINNSESIERYFDIHPTVNTGLNATITFRYSNWELNSINESDLVLFRSPNNGATWSNQGFATRDSVSNTVSLSGVNRFSRWTLGSALDPLPVELIRYTAHKEEQNAVLEWTTITEKDNAGYLVEVSTDGHTFSELGTVAVAQANSSSGQQYQYIDETPGKNGVRYYRLLQIDLNGSRHSLGVRSVRFDKLVTAVSVYPNPFFNSFTAQLSASGAEIARLVLYDGVGRMVSEQQVHLEAGDNHINFSVDERWAAGTYLLQIKRGGQLHNSVLIKQ